MSSVCPPQLPACPREASASAEQSPEQLGMGRSPYGDPSVTPRPLHLPLGYPPRHLSSSVSSISRGFFSSCVISVHLRGSGNSNLRVLVFFLRGGWGAGAWWHGDLPAVLRRCPKKLVPRCPRHSLLFPPHSPRAQAKFLLKPTGTLPDRGI